MKNNKKIALINPASPWQISDFDHPPLGLLYLAGYLSKYMAVEFINLASKDKIELPFADYYGITGCVSHDSQMKEIARKAKQVNPDAWVIAGGAHASTTYDWPTTFNYILRGINGEEQISYILDLPMPESIDDIIPDYNLATDYSTIIDYSDLTLRGITVMTSRGCPNNCAFCASCVISKRKVYFHSIEYVKTLLRLLLALGFKGFHFPDDIFTLKKNRLFKLCNILKDLKVPWRCFSRTEQINPTMLKEMKESGCRQISIGIESGSQAILDKVKKGIDINEAKKKVDMIIDSGIIPSMFFIVGLPGENMETIEATKKFIDQYIDKAYFALSIFVPYPETPIYKNPKAFAYDLDYSIPYDLYMGKDNPVCFERGLKRKDQILYWFYSIQDMINGKSAKSVGESKIKGG